MGKERTIANPIAGTTRDAIDSTVKIHGKNT
jgi:predicted GTPase